ncbi:MAG: hypothetical protein DRP42_04140 [Tenericutes bacterium]|nr:MAG: hypothetical protein DRP42_04140 [Mycoplasmatota bacterium]
MSIIGTGLAIGSAVGKVVGSKRREDETNQAQVNQQNIERKIRAEQATRERREQIRSARMLSANAEAASVAQGGPSSGSANTKAGIQGDFSSNMADINFGMATGNIMSTAQQDTMNAGRPSTFENFNAAMSPLIMGNVADINSATKSWFE